MKTISVREMKANWAEIEAQVAAGEEFEVLNRGKPAAKIIATTPRRVLKWPKFLETAVKNQGLSAEETIRAIRDGN